jgi:glucose/mannose-6-phosphate isomerase
MKPNLDNGRNYKEAGAAEIFGHLRQFPEQCRIAWQKAQGFELPAAYRDIDRVLVLGMGGSAIGGEIAGGFTGGRVQVCVHRDYGLPYHPDERTLVIASSYSGNTEETLSGFTEALGTPAKKLAMTTGGRLKELAEERNIPVYIIDYKSPPRMAFPHSFMPVLCIFNKLGLMGQNPPDVQPALEAIKRLRDEYSEECPLSANPAKQMAERLAGRIVVVYGSGVLGAVARRWKTQINENAKNWAFFENFPELCHNAIVGYGLPQDIKDRIIVLMLRPPHLSPRLEIRYEAVEELLIRGRIKHESVLSAGEDDLAQVLSLVLLGDYVSSYLAILNGVDPLEIKAIDCIKDCLRG